MANLLPAQNATDTRFSAIDQVADVTKNGSTSLGATDLVLPIAASETRLFFALLGFITTATADIKFNFDAPAGAVGWQMAQGDADNATNPIGTAVMLSGNAGGTNESAWVFANIKNGGTAGNVTLQFAQNFSQAADTKVLAGSGMFSVKVS